MPNVFFAFAVASGRCQLSASCGERALHTRLFCLSGGRDADRGFLTSACVDDRVTDILRPECCALQILPIDQLCQLFCSIVSASSHA